MGTCGGLGCPFSPPSEDSCSLEPDLLGKDVCSVLVLCESSGLLQACPGLCLQFREATIDLDQSCAMFN